MSSLYLLGGRQKNLRLKKEEEWNLYEAALIVELNPESGDSQQRVEYHSPIEARASENASHLFKAGTVVGNTLYSCTSTEVIVFRLPDFSQIGYISLPCFNDLHHVAPTHDGNLAIASTGLDLAVKVSPQGDVLNYWPVLDSDPWARFSPWVDYRKVDSTKPHLSHPNFVFEIEDQTWVTRFKQKDAICLSRPGPRIDIAVQSPHDGLVCGSRVYFTTVDGQIVIANSRTLGVDQIIDLKQIGDGKALLGWCRGILPLDERRVWVAFTRVRKTKFSENILWVKNVFHEGMGEKPTHIALYDIVDRQCLAEIDIEPLGLNVIFSILPAYEKPQGTNHHAQG
jgi:hypothetical protein